MNTPMICTSLQVKKGAWTEEEDYVLKRCIQKYGEGKWHLVPTRAAGLNRCRKSCRLRWLNYLSPYIKRGDFDSDEIDLILRLHKLLGNRWSLIAGRLPGRTGNDVKNYWNTHIQRKLINTIAPQQQERSKCKANAIIRPQPRRFRSAKNVSLSNNKSIVNEEPSIDNDTQWWANILESCNKIEEATAAGIRTPSCKNISSKENCNEIDKTPSLLNGGGANCMQQGQSGDDWDEFSVDDIWNLLNN